MLNEQQFGKMKNQQSSNPAINTNGKSFKQAKLPKFQTPEEKILDNAKTRRLNAAAYKDQELGRLAHFESLKLRSQKEEEKRKKPTKK
jgi:hypothetical protein